MQHFVEKFVSNLQQVSGFLRALRFPPLIKLTRHGIAEILLKVALNTITHSQSCLKQCDNYYKQQIAQINAKNEQNIARYLQYFQCSVNLSLVMPPATKL
jgi:hypothetical protein